MRFHTRPRRTPTVIIVSLIDIFAILLIFVIVTTTFKSLQPEVSIKLPESSTAGPSEAGEEPLLLTISKDSAIFLNEQETPLSELGEAIRRAASGSKRIAMKADTEAPFGTIIKVLDVLKEAGVTSGVSAFTQGSQ